MDKPRVRFAPSPTGNLHVGNARAALFNWLYARHHGGVFILRIEDTDLERSTEESVDGVLRDLRWLGLDWDEGPGTRGDHAPYFQSERGDQYRAVADELLRRERAYPCYCTPDEVNARREALRQAGEAPRYDRKCLHLDAAQRARFEAEGRPRVLRLRTDYSGQTVVDDLIRGTVGFDNEVLDDFVLIKSDGMPAYNFAVVVDDHFMQITHVIRGEDHLSNTPRQIQVYQALGWELPHFAHLPMILGPDRQRLSKRHGATSVTQFRDEGYLSEALVNYLALLGWSYDDRHELFSRDELVDKFTLERVSKHAAIFDMERLTWMNGVYLREADVGRLTDLAIDKLQKAGLLMDPVPEDVRGRIQGLMEPLQKRLRTLNDVVPQTRFLFVEELEFDSKAVRKFLCRDYVPGMFASLVDSLLHVKPFNHAGVEQIFAGLGEQLDKKLGDVIQPVRVALTGGTVSPPMYDVIVALGRAKTCERLKRAGEMAKAGLREAAHIDP